MNLMLNFLIQLDYKIIEKITLTKKSRLIKSKWDNKMSLNIDKVQICTFICCPLRH